MITTRFGSEVKILCGNIENGTVDIETIEDGKHYKTYIAELKADNGICEIAEAIESVNNKTDSP